MMEEFENDFLDSKSLEIEMSENTSKKQKELDTKSKHRKSSSLKRDQEDSGELTLIKQRSKHVKFTKE